MTAAPATRAVANLHLHLEYDSGLDVIAAAMAAVPDDVADSDAERAHVTRDISSALAHLLDVRAMTPDGSPIRVTDYAVDVSVDIEAADDDADPLTEHTADVLASEAFEGFRRLALTEDEVALIADGMQVAGTAGPPPFEVPADDPDVPLLIAQWTMMCGYLARACSYVMDLLFDDLDLASAQLPGVDTFLVSHLPEQWADHITPLFHRRFIVTMADVTTRVAGDWEPPSTLAQEVALDLLVTQALALAEMAAEDPDLQVREVPDEMFLVLGDRLQNDELLEMLYDPDAEEALAVDYWFVPFDDGATAPYATDDIG